MSDFDEAAVKSALANAQKVLASEAENTMGKHVAAIEVETLSILARSLGVAV